MKLTDYILALLGGVEMFLQIFVGIVLIIINKKKKNALLYLGIMLMASSLVSLTNVLDIFNQYAHNTYLDIMPFYFTWFIPVIILVYVEKVMYLKITKTTYYLLIPSILEFIMNSIIYFFPYEEKNKIKDSNWFLWTDFIGVLFSFAVFIYIIKKINKYQKHLENNYSSTENRDLNWVKNLLYLFFAFFLFMIIINVFLSEFYEELFLVAYGIFIVFWISYYGMIQQISDKAIILNNTKNIISIENKNHQKDKSNDEKNIKKYNTIYNKVNELLIKEELYLNPELTIIDIAEKINEHPRLISTSINRIYKQNFNSYINCFRVKKAEKMLLNDTSSKLNIEGIGLEAGFKNNSSFYRAFKKELKTTPLQFLKNK